MVIYYDPQRPAILFCLKFKGTACAIVYGRPEFWLYQLFHAVGLLFLKMGTYKVRNFEWESVAIVQFLLTFFVLFYSNQCMVRYLTLYHNCMTAFHRVVLFVMELVIAMPIYARNIQAGTPAGRRALRDFAEAQRCRRAATRYAVAAVYLFFMNVTGGTAPGAEWSECTRKGLLTFGEAQMLQDYPGPTFQCLLVLTSWALQTVHTGLALDVFWQPRCDSHNHSHDRMTQHLREMVCACNKVAHIIALPIPFPYYHLVNVILVLNFLVLGMGLATLEVYASIFVYFAAVLIFMSIREVSVQLSDPFGLDEVDFPIAKFLDYVFDAAVSLLEAYTNPLSYANMDRHLEANVDFTESQMTWPPLDEEQLYGSSWRHKINTPGNWNRDMPIHASVELASKGNVKRYLGDALSKGAKRPKPVLAPTDDEEEDEHAADILPEAEVEPEFDEVRNALQPPPIGKADDDDEDEPDVPLKVLVTSANHLTDADDLIMINVDPTDIVSDVKYRLHEKSQVAPHHQALKFKNRPMDDDRTLAFYNIKANDMVHLFYEEGTRSTDAGVSSETMECDIKELNALRAKTDDAQTRLRSLREELGLALDAPLMSVMTKRAKEKSEEARHEELERAKSEIEEARTGIRDALQQARRKSFRRLSEIKELVGEAGLGAVAVGYMTAGAAVVGTGVAGTAASIA